MTKFISLFVIVSLFVFCFSACSNNNIEVSLINKFNRNSDQFNSIVNYIDSTVIGNKNFQSLPRKTILLCGHSVKFDSTDYRMCDNFLEQKMKNLGISVISVEKSRCQINKNFDLIVFEINETGFSKKNYYYQFSFCNENGQNVENDNIKNIPLMEKWALFIEKN